MKKVVYDAFFANYENDIFLISVIRLWDGSNEIETYKINNDILEDSIEVFSKLENDKSDIEKIVTFSKLIKENVYDSEILRLDLAKEIVESLLIGSFDGGDIDIETNGSISKSNIAKLI